MDVRSRENFLIHIMNSGFDKAAASFTKLINRPVKIVNSQSILVRHDDDFSYISEEKGDLYILITRIIGDISGKSFLILNDEESQEIFKAVNTSLSNQMLNEAFLLEIDNIISASVIAELSNTLELEIYGDVPKLLKVHANELQDFLTNEIASEDPAGIIFSNTTFQFDSKDKIHPQFIWKLSSRIFELIPTDPSPVKA
jgi:chemotaxis protein CheY-P-specific phosphatase CheC